MRRSIVGIALIVMCTALQARAEYGSGDAGGGGLARPAHGNALSGSDSMVSFGVQVSYADDAHFGIGGRAVWSLDSLVEKLELVTSFDWFFPADDNLLFGSTDLDYYEINLNAVYPVLDSAGLSPYVGGGLHIARTSFHIEVANGFRDSETDVGLNLLGGLKLEGDSRVKPFVEARMELSGAEQLVVTGGILF